MAANNSCVTQKIDFPLVGIGTSAEGVQVLKSFFGKTRAKADTSYVIISHHEPQHKSLLPEILSRHTPIKVKQIAKDEKIEPRHIYIAPPDRRLVIEGNFFKLQEPFEKSNKALPIDHLFKSMAEELHERAIAIVLSGTMSDGCSGIKHIKERGGITIAQSPTSTAHCELPQNAINTDYIDLVCAAEAIPEVLENFLAHFHADNLLSFQNLDELEEIIAIVKRNCHYDFRPYKKNTLIRRIFKRMGILQIASTKDYAKKLNAEPEEAKTLLNDFLIGVTEFFRDPNLWEILDEKVIKTIVNQNLEDSPIRVWVPGCSTGEEAYSLAIRFAEAFEISGKNLNLQIFATDINEKAINSARRGFFPATVASHIPAQLLKKYFTFDNHGFLIDKEIRKTVVFAMQDVLTDPPFSDLDLISCRNLLIYLDAEAQKSIMEIFSFALRSHGFLVLGSSETAKFNNNLLKTISKRFKIYQVTGRQNDRKTSGGFPTSFLKSHVRDCNEPQQSNTGLNFDNLMQKHLLKKFGPASVIVNKHNQIVYFYGATEKFLNLPQNKPVFDLFSMAKEVLRNQLRIAVYKARKNQQNFSITLPSIELDNSKCEVSIEGTLLQSEKIPEGMLLVSFIDKPTTQDRSKKSPNSSDKDLISLLEKELQDIREDLESTIEKLEASNEELNASNEEMMSMNEEYQAANEDLETSKEELQTLNDELVSLNARLKEKIKELEVANNDIVNLSNSNALATIFLDRNSVIRMITPAARKLLCMVQSDIGRPVNHFNSKLIAKSLDEKIAQVLDSLMPESEEIDSEDGRFFVRKVLPFITGDNRINGVVITFFEITEIKNSEIALRKSKEKLKETNHLLSAVLSHTHILTATLDKDFNYIWVNKSFVENFGKAEDYFQGKNHFILYPNAENKAIFQKVVDTKEAVYLTAKAFVFPDQPERGLTYWDWSLIPVKDVQNRITSLVFTLVEVTRKVKAEIAFRQESKLRENLLESINDGFFSLDKNLRVTYFNKAAARILNRSSKKVLGKYVFDAFPEARGSIFEEKYQQALEKQKSFEFEIFFEVEPIDNWYQVKITPFNEGISVFFVVTTEQKRAQQLLIEQSQSLKQAQQIAQIGTWKWDTKTDQFFLSEEMFNIFGLEKTRLPITAEKIVNEFVQPEDREKFNEVFAKVRAQNAFIAFEFKISRPDGQAKTLWIEACNSDKTNKIDSIISGIIHDITERKKTELERLRLEKFASKSQKIDALGTLAGGIAHNFNNFLCGVFGNIELAIDEAKTERRNRFLNNAMKSMETAKALTRQLVTFSSGGDPEKTGGNIWNVVKDAANFALAGANLRLQIEEPGDLWHCLFDHGQISQVVNNLIINSRQAMPDGGEITLKAQNVNVANGQIDNLPPGKFVKISVCDNGPGIPDKYAGRIFDPFFSTKVTNQGLGLAISYSIVARHGGVLALQPHAENCTCFSIFLPAHEESAASMQKAETMPFAKSKQFSGNILVMDDEEMVREILSEMLASLGFRVHCTKDGQEAVHELVNNKSNYKAAILDLTVPGKMGGKEACEILRDSGVRIFLFAASGYSSDPIITHPKEFGFDGSITKPFSLEDLFRTIQ